MILEFALDIRDSQLQGVHPVTEKNIIADSREGLHKFRVFILI